MNNPSATLFRSHSPLPKVLPHSATLTPEGTVYTREAWLTQSLSDPLARVSGDNGHRKQQRCQQSVSSCAVHAPASLQRPPRAGLSSTVQELHANRVVSTSACLHCSYSVRVQEAGIQDWTVSASLAPCMH